MSVRIFVGKLIVGKKNIRQEIGNWQKISSFFTDSFSSNKVDSVSSKYKSHNYYV